MYSLSLDLMVNLRSAAKKHQMITDFCHGTKNMAMLRRCDLNFTGVTYIGLSNLSGRLSLWSGASSSVLLPGALLHKVRARPTPIEFIFSSLELKPDVPKESTGSLRPIPIEMLVLNLNTPRNWCCNWCCKMYGRVDGYTAGKPGIGCKASRVP